MTTDEPHEQPKLARTRQRMLIICCVLLFTVGSYVAFRVVVSNRVKTKLDAIRAEGFPVTLEELDEWYLEPPAGENAAEVYEKAFANYMSSSPPRPAGRTGRDDFSGSTDWDRWHRVPVVGSTKLPPLGDPLSDRMKGDIAWYLGEHEKALALLHEAAKLERCRFPADLSSGPGVILNHLSLLRQGARLLRLEAILHAEEGRREGAVTAVCSSLALSRSLDREPVLISYLVRISCNSMSCRSLERILSRTILTDEQLARFAEACAAAEDPEGVTRAMAGERCMGVAILTSPAVGVAVLTSSVAFASTDAPLPKFFEILHKIGYADIDLGAYLEIMNEQVRTSQLPLPQRLQVTDPLETRVAELPRYSVARIVLPGLARVLIEDAKGVARARAAVTALAVERYRLARAELPGVLADLVPDYLKEIPPDPFDGSPLRYKKLGEGYVVYSIGENGVDDGGVEEDPSISRAQIRPDVVFRVER